MDEYYSVCFLFKLEVLGNLTHLPLSKINHKYLNFSLTWGVSYQKKISGLKLKYFYFNEMKKKHTAYDEVGLKHGTSLVFEFRSKTLRNMNSSVLDRFWKEKHQQLLIF